jgi:hypothetical protein
MISCRRVNRVFVTDLSLLFLSSIHNTTIGIATMLPFHIDKISLHTFNNVLSRYPATVPEKLRDLDTARYDTIPAAVAARSPKSLTKDEVVQLVEWKL